VLLLPKRYALAPALILLSIHLVEVILITTGLKPNPYLKNVIFKKSTPQVLDDDGDFRGPGQEKIAIFLLGAKSNHPLGIFGPDFMIADWFITRMSEQLEDPMSQDAGCEFFFPCKCGWG
jgi:hypothetical protein